MRRDPRQTFTIELPERQPLSPEAQQFLNALSRQIAAVRAGKLCCCKECIEKETLSALAGYCAIRIALNAQGNTHEQMDGVLAELAQDLPHMCIARAQARGAGDHDGN